MSFLKKAIRVKLKILSSVIGLIVVLGLGVVLLFNFLDLEKYQPQIEAKLKADYGIVADLSGPITLGFANMVPSIAVESLKYGEPLVLSAKDVEISLANAKELWASYKNGAPLDVLLKAKLLNTGGLDFKDVSLPLYIAKEIKTKKPMDARVYDARLKANAETKGARLYLDGTLSSLVMSQFNPGLEFNLDTKANLSGKMDDSFVNSLKGTVVLKSDGGEISGKVINLWGGDVLINLLPGGKKNTELVCMIAPFEIENGIASTDGIIINTGRVLVLGKGSIDLNAQTINFVFKPKPKDVSLVNLSTPVTVKGDINSPKVSLKKMEVAKKIGGIIASAINPAALVFTFSKMGSDIEGDDCFKAANVDGKAKPKTEGEVKPETSEKKATNE